MFTFRSTFSFFRDVARRNRLITRQSCYQFHVESVVGKRSLSCNSKSEPASIVCEQLLTRSLIRVAGADASKFLQGVVTNDMQLLEQSAEDGTKMCSSVFSLLLNHQGRVLYDVFIYNCATDESTFVIECDSRIEANLCKHLNTFNIRRKIKVEPLSTDFKVWTLFPASSCMSEADNVLAQSEELEDLLKSTSHTNDHVLVSTLDPRLPSLCSRLVLNASKTPKDIFSHLNFASDDSLDYMTLRYRCGIGEGALELPSANCFPLECNGDYLHGVNFHKGCYVGQELTSRTHHTGVVRKRIMPLIFSSAFTGDRSEDPVVSDQHGRAVGKVRGAKGKYGIGVMRIEQCLKPDTMLFCEMDSVKLEVKVHKPSWWP